MDHGAEDLALLAHHMGPQIPLVDVPVGVVEVAVLEEDASGPGLHQVLIGEVADALAVQQHDLVLGPGDGDLVQPGHVIELALLLAAAAAEEALAGDLLPVGKDPGLLHLRHGHGEALKPGLGAQLLAAGLQIFRHLQLLRRAAAVDKVGVQKDLFQSALIHGACSFLFLCSQYSRRRPETQQGGLRICRLPCDT